MTTGYVPIREFDGSAGVASTLFGGPDYIEKDLDKLMKMFNPAATHTGGTAGGIGTNNIQVGAITDALIGNLTPDTNISVASFTGTDQLRVVISVLAKMNFLLIGESNWWTSPVKSVKQLNTDISTVAANLLTHRSSVTDHNNIYYTEGEIDTALSGMKGAGYTNQTLKGLSDLITSLQTQINNLNNTFSTDAERIAAINDVINQFQIADGNLNTMINNKANSADVYTKTQVDAMNWDTPRIIDRAITSIKLALGAVKNENIEDSAVTLSKLHPTVAEVGGVALHATNNSLHKFQSGSVMSAQTNVFGNSNIVGYGKAFNVLEIVDATHLVVYPLEKELQSDPTQPSVGDVFYYVDRYGTPVVHSLTCTGFVIDGDNNWIMTYSSAYNPSTELSTNEGYESILCTVPALTVDYAFFTSLVGGESNVSTAQDSVMFGWTNYAGATGAFINGQNNRVFYESDFAHVEGTDNVVTKGYHAHVEGEGNVVKNSQISHVEGQSNRSEDSYNHIEGSYNVAYSSANHIEGNQNIAALGLSVMKVVSVTGNTVMKIDVTGSLSAEYPIGTEVSMVILTVSPPSRIEKAVVTEVDDVNKTLTVSPGFTTQPYCIYQITSSTSGSHVEGTDNISMGMSSYVGGTDNIAVGNYNHTHGVSNKVFLSENADVSGQENNISGGDLVAVHGYGNEVTDSHKAYVSGSYNKIISSEFASAVGEDITIEGDYANVTGKGNYGCGNGFTIEGMGNVVFPGYVLNVISRTNPGAKITVDSGSFSVGDRIAMVYGIDSNYPACIVYTVVAFDSGTKEITFDSDMDNQSDPSYYVWIDTMIGNAYNNHAEGKDNTVIDTIVAHVEGYGNMVAGDFSHAEGRYNGTYADNTHVEGIYAAAISKSSHAEGFATVAGIATLYTVTSSANWATSKTLTLNSVAGLSTSSWIRLIYKPASNNRYTQVDYKISAISGNDVTIIAPDDITNPIYVVLAGSGDGSNHAEGYNTIASGLDSHAEGNGTKATGNFSHAGGYLTTASGEGSSADGFYSQANARSAHAQNEDTRANGRYQTAIGKFNVAQGTDVAPAATDLAVIVGNGADDANRRNMLTMNWDGDLWASTAGYFGGRGFHIEQDFIGPLGTYAPFASTAIGAGSIALLTTANTARPGMVTFSCSTSANTGYSLATSFSAFGLGAGGEVIEFTAMVSSVSPTVKRLGFMNSATTSAPANGAYFEIADLVLTAKTRKASVETVGSGSYTLTNNSWYRFRIEVKSSSEAVFSVFNSGTNATSTPVFTTTITTNIPTSNEPVGIGALAYITSASGATVMMTLDLILAYCNRRLYR